METRRIAANVAKLGDTPPDNAKLPELSRSLSSGVNHKLT
jgi:hypothetical protein